MAWSVNFSGKCVVSYVEYLNVLYREVRVLILLQGHQGHSFKTAGRWRGTWRIIKLGSFEFVNPWVVELLSGNHKPPFIADFQLPFLNTGGYRIFRIEEAMVTNQLFFLQAPPVRKLIWSCINGYYPMEADSLLSWWYSIIIQLQSTIMLKNDLPTVVTMPYQCLPESPSFTKFLTLRCAGVEPPLGTDPQWAWHHLNIKHMAKPWVPGFITCTILDALPKTRTGVNK